MYARFRVENPVFPGNSIDKSFDNFSKTDFPQSCFTEFSSINFPRLIRTSILIRFAERKKTSWAFVIMRFAWLSASKYSFDEIKFFDIGAPGNFQSFCNDRCRKFIATYYNKFNQIVTNKTLKSIGYNIPFRRR